MSAAPSCGGGVAGKVDSNKNDGAGDDGGGDGDENAKNDNSNSCNNVNNRPLVTIGIAGGTGAGKVS